MRSNVHTRGFTFLEIVIAISILAVIMGVSFGALTQIMRAKKMLDDARDSKAIADSIIQRLSRELQLASRSGGAIMPPPNKLSTPYPGQPRLLGTAKRGKDGQLDAITFLAQEAGQYIPDGGTHTGIVQIQYHAEEDPENRSGENYFLVRDEVPYVRPFDAAYKKLMTFPITKNLVSLQFRYYSSPDNAWYDTWGEPPRTKLPNLVKFIVRIRSPLGIINRYETSVFIPASER